ncbi:MAG TPA: lamin tail domain-containing protein, partial [Candidatus Eisenbacteria bacterium]
MPAVSLLLTAALSCLPAGHPIVAEVYYDAPGVDTGYEFVEIWNAGDAPASLTGLRLEAGDGAGPGRWTLRWTGGPADSLPPHARFVIGGALVVPAPDRVVTLDLQNGPDAMRLVWPDGATEVVGWGAHDFPEYYCGEPAVDVAGGQSLARIPDAAATGSNAGDFRPADPSPGRANVRARDAA